MRNACFFFFHSRPLLEILEIYVVVVVAASKIESKVERSSGRVRWVVTRLEFLHRYLELVYQLIEHILQSVLNRMRASTALGNRQRLILDWNLFQFFSILFEKKNLIMSRSCLFLFVLLFLKSLYLFHECRMLNHDWLSSETSWSTTRTDRKNTTKSSYQLDCGVFSTSSRFLSSKQNKTKTKIEQKY